MIGFSPFRFATVLLLLSAPAFAQTWTKTRISSTPDPSTLNQRVTLTAEVDSRDNAPTGAVTFTDGAAQLGAVTLRAIGAGQATVAAGLRHTCALSNTGAVKCWGGNELGQLGDGTHWERNTPANVPGLEKGIIALHAGESHTCALTNSSGVKCWGDNMFGQIGNDSPGVAPVDVVGLTSGVVALTAGASHSCALTSVGDVKCWGKNLYGQLGDGTKSNRSTPVAVLGLRGVIAISAGASRTCALTSAGGVKCWGSGQLTPVDVSGLTSGAASLSVGSRHSCAVTSAGEVKCWGDNFAGQLGDGTTITRLTPVSVTGVTGAVAITAGDSHSCALSSAGAVKCWGWNKYGQIGDGTKSNRPTPLAPAGLTDAVSVIVAGRYHTCAVTGVGAMKCWGDNSYGALGNGTGSFYNTPQQVVAMANGVVAITTGVAHSCARTGVGGVKCWGMNSPDAFGQAGGQLGDGTTTDRTAPVDVLGLSSGIDAVSAGGAHSCALTTVGGVKCWGANNWGQLGDGTDTTRLTPQAVTGLSGGVTSVAAGIRHSCAVLGTGNVKCWGYNFFGELGDGTQTNSSTPVDVVGISDAVALSLGGNHTCALTSTGGLKCWGSNFYGQLGDNSTTQRLTPVDVYGLSSGVIGVAAGEDHSCALTSGGVKCWGSNYEGQVGDGSTGIGRIRPKDVVGLSTGVAAVAARYNRSCALTTTGDVKCWGNYALTPESVAGLSGVTSLALGYSHTCVLTSGGGVKCIGNDGFGQVGDGIPLYFPTPTPTLSFAALLRARARMGISALGIGAHAIKATYPGDATHAGSSGATNQSVN